MKVIKKLKLAVLISGNGTNLQAFIDAIQNGLSAEIAIVISNEPDAYGLERAKHAKIPTAVICHRDFPNDRSSFEKALQNQLDSHHIDLIILAGFMRILSPEFVHHYEHRILNIHPSLLPKYPGLHTHQQVVAAGEKSHGCTVHLVTADLDAGPILAQARIPVLAKDSAATLKDKVQSLEHQLYPKVVAYIAQGRLQCRTNPITFDGQPLPSDGVHSDDISLSML
jgi:phosphoribosylglycinamide formyltransferase-1